MSPVTWDTAEDWEEAEESNNISVENGFFQLAESIDLPQSQAIARSYHPATVIEEYGPADPEQSQVLDRQYRREEVR